MLSVLWRTCYNMPAIEGAEDDAAIEGGDPVPEQDGIPQYWGPIPDHVAVLAEKDTEEEHEEPMSTPPPQPDTIRKISVKAAIRDMPDRAVPAIQKELGQMLRRGVWVPKRWRDLTPAERAAVLRSSMFCRDKVAVSGVAGAFKARFVAGGNGQDKALYEEEGLSSPTASTTSLLIVAATSRQPTWEGRS